MSSSAIEGALYVDSFYTPLPKHVPLHTSLAKNLLGIGGNNSGKSMVLIGEAVYNALEYPGSNVLLLRRDYPELEKGLILDFKNTVPKEIYHYNDQKHIATFQNDAKIFFGHLQNSSEKSLSQYLSSAFIFIGIDELGQFSFGAWNFLSSRNRVNKGCKANSQGLMPYCRMGAATNPLGPGYGWIKRIWIDKQPVSQMGDVQKIDGKWFSRVYDKTMLANEEFRAKITWIEGDPWICVYDPKEYFYVHSTILDNPYAAERDPEAITKLMRLAPDLRQKALYGDLESVAGSYFSNFTQERNVMSLPKDNALIRWEDWQPLWIGIDFGLAHHTAVYWNRRAKVYDEMDQKWKDHAITIRELVVTGKSYDEICDLIAQNTSKEETSKVRFIFLSPEMFSRETTGHTPAEEMSRRLREHNLPMCSRANNQRVDGALFMYNLIETGDWIILDNCPMLISSIETRIRDMDHNKPEDVLKTDDELDDAYDSIRYALLSMLKERAKPEAIKYQEKLESIPDPTARAIYAYKNMLKQQGGSKFFKPKFGRSMRPH